MDINQESIELVPKYQSVVSELEKTKQENENLKKKKWIEYYNNVVHHSGLDMKSPLKCRKLKDQVVYLKWGESGHAN